MPVARALVPILRDLLATFVFVALFWITDNIFVATAFGMALGLSQTLWTRLRGRAVGPLQWLTLVLITVFGGATILFHEPRFIMVKPSLLWLALGIVLLRRDWMAPYLPPIVTENLDDRVIVRAGYAYATLMFTLAVMNLAVAYAASPKFWSVYALIAPAAGQMVLLLALYFRFRKRIESRIRARAATEPQTARIT
ncbi:MAG TPA: septation protein IspZ [Rhizomicrobium sp.]|nr:septation protein IspZ [Rhizomicrobium sp.]